MSIAFFVSSIGDTDLAKATIAKLVEQDTKNSLFLIPLTATALNHTKDLSENERINRVSIEYITQQADMLSKDQISSEELEKISQFIDQNKIQHAYVGVPSINNEIPFQIAHQLNIPCTIAYEYMFKPEKHTFWNYVDSLAAKGNCDFAVPLKAAEKDILEINSKANIHAIGHLSIDRAQTTNTRDPNEIAKIRESLLDNIKDEFIFMSGTTQPAEVDNQFLDALLSEICTGKYPNLQLRMGIHPGVKEPDIYLQTLLNTCQKYSTASGQFKIILTSPFEKRLQFPVSLPSFILRSEVSGADAAQAADKVTQAVPGALLNEAALKGKPCYFHQESAVPYLPRTLFSENLSAFFTAKPKSPPAREELGLEKDTAPNLLVKLMTR